MPFSVLVKHTVTKTKKRRKQWDSQILGKAAHLAVKVPFCSPALVLPPFKRTSREDCEEPSTTSSSPGRCPKSSSRQFSKPHAEIPLLLKKNFAFPNFVTSQNVSTLKAFKLTANVADRFCSSYILSDSNGGKHGCNRCFQNVIPARRNYRGGGNCLEDGVIQDC